MKHSEKTVRLSRRAFLHRQNHPAIRATLQRRSTRLKPQQPVLIYVPVFNGPHHAADRVNELAGAMDTWLLPIPSGGENSTSILWG